MSVRSVNMAKKMSRRDFVVTSAAAGLGVTAPHSLLSQTPTVYTPNSVKPVVIASANGNQYRNGGRVTCVEQAFSMITTGYDVLDGLIAGVSINELDPADGGVGYGGAPNADGVVQLDSCCMHGPMKRAGGVAALEGVKIASLVAKSVMNNTDHHLLVGDDAQSFARKMGFTIEDDLNTEESRQRWLEWKRRTGPDHYPVPDLYGMLGYEVGLQMMTEGIIDEHTFWGTINCDGISPRGEICGVTTTSGLSWKIPGRVGDSPIVGAGLYVDGDVGAAGSTGRGEANLYNLTSFLIVENMRRGMHPKDAGMEGLKRIKQNTVEKRLLNSKKEPAFGVNFYMLNAKGEYAGVSMYAGENSQYAICTENGSSLLALEPLLEGSPLG